MRENILVFAYNMERDSAKFYAKMSNQVKGSYVKIMFNELSEEEFKHQQILEKMIKRQVVPKLPNVEIPDIHLSDILDKPELTDDMVPKDIIAYVIKMEEEAISLYQSLYNAATNLEDKETYSELIKMESVHKYRFQRVLEDISLWEK